jgi:hypothetical protein
MVPAKPEGQEPPRRKATRRSPPLGAAALLFGLALSAPVLAASEDEGLRGPDVVIIAEEERTIFEFRQGGELRMVRIVPRVGKPYYLVPRDQTQGYGNLERADMLLPSWVIVEF